MKKYVACLVAGCVVTGCAALQPALRPDGSAAAPRIEGATDTLRPVARPGTPQSGSPAPLTTARTAEEFDTTTTAERGAAVADVSGTARAEQRLGMTVASLGAPSEPGFWLKTPLVRTAAQGRVHYPESGKSVAVSLIPIDGPDTAGSRLSLPAMRLIDAPLAGLPELEVFKVTD